MVKMVNMCMCVCDYSGIYFCSIVAKMNIIQLTEHLQDVCMCFRVPCKDKFFFSIIF